MATKENEWTESTTAANPDDGWTEVDAEAKIVIEVIGDGFTGRYMGMEQLPDSGIKQVHITNAEFLDGTPLADKAFVNATRDLENKLRNIPIKSMIRVQWISEMDTGHESGTKMRVFKVQWK